MLTTSHPTKFSRKIATSLLGKAAGVAGLAGALLLALTPPVDGATTTIRMMPLGDSITAGFQSSDNNGYRQTLYNDLRSAGDLTDFVGSIHTDGNAFDPDHEGHTGYEIAQVAALLDGVLATYQPNLITLHIGTNDMGNNDQVATAPSRLASMIDQIFNDLPGVTLIVSQLIPSANSDTQTRITAYNNQIPAIVQTRAAAGKHIYMVSMSSLTTADLNADGIHPNDGGYQKMAGVWNTGIQQVISKGWVSNVPFAGVYEIQCVSSSQVMDVNGGSTANNAAVIQYPYGNTRNQLWNFIPTSSGYYQIKNANSALDVNVTGASTAPGALIVQYQFGTSNNDQWRPALNSDGTYSFYNRNSGLVLEVPGFSQQQTTQLDQYAGNSGSNQKFNLISK